MAIKKKQIATEEASVPVSAMLDVVFLLIIFFVVTAAVDKEVEDEAVQLADAPHGKPIQKRDPRSVIINVHENGDLTVGMGNYDIPGISNILRVAKAKYGPEVPIVIRGDGRTQHYHISKVQKAVTETGLYKVRFMAVQSQ